LLQELNRVVRSTKCFRTAEEAGKLMRLPTGDGMALIFFRSPEEPVQCALEISGGLKDHPEIRLRMGIHSGPINQVTDVNDRSNVAGAGINVAQRVLDCGDAGHILLSKHLADDLSHYRHWQPYLHDLGECEVKHALRLHIVNLCKDGLGNQKVPEKLRGRGRWRHADSSSVRPVRAPQWPKYALWAALLLCFGTLVLSFSLLWHRSRPPIGFGADLGPPVYKSIAVLPFKNLGSEGENAYLADGVQDEILTDLARVADLKVISRTSVMQYKSGAERNLREIARQLGVAHIVEGSVQTSGNRVRVIAQLIDARTDTHVWAQRYDGDLADVFALESDVAEKIVAQLKSKLSPEEKAAIEERPTADLAAYDLYVRAKKLIDKAVFNAPRQESLFNAVTLLEEAVRRDSSFFLAYYQLAHAHDQIFLNGIDHTPERLALASAAIRSLVRLHPDSGEAHLAMAKHLYWGYLNYEEASQEAAVARTALPNDPWPFLLAGYLDRRQGRWEDSLTHMKRALSLDPRNFFILQQISITYENLRRFPEMAGALDRALMLAPKDPTILSQRAVVDLEERADPKPLHRVIQTIVTADPKAAAVIAHHWLYLALCERDNDAATRALAVLPSDACECQGLSFPQAWCEGLVAQQRGEGARAQNALAKAHAEMAGIVQAQPNYAEAVCVLGLMEAALGQKDLAIARGRRAVELMPTSKDFVLGAVLAKNLAVIYAAVGEKDLALEQLTRAAEMPGDVNYGDLRLNPAWDPLRGDPRFDQIVGSLAPK
jgi:serine/threonine-protein kinase